MRVAREGGSGSVSTSVSPHGSPLRLQRPICVISTLRVHQRRFIMALSACKRAMAPFISPWLLAPRRLYLVPNITRYYSKSSHKYHHQTRMGKLLRQASFNTLLSRIFHQSSRSFHLSISCVHRCTNRVTLHAVAAFQRCRLLAPCGHVHSIKNRGMSAVASLFHINKKHTRRAPNAAAGLRLTPISLRTIGYHTSIPFKNARHAYGAPQFSADSVVCALH